MAYVKKQHAADITFNVFAFCWVVSRIGLLPYRIIYYSSYVALGVVPMFSAYYIFNGLLIALQTLHIIWTYFIIRVAIHAWNNNGVRYCLLNQLRWLSIFFNFIVYRYRYAISDRMMKKTLRRKMAFLLVVAMRRNVTRNLTISVAIVRPTRYSMMGRTKIYLPHLT